MKWLSKEDLIEIINRNTVVKRKTEYLVIKCKGCSKDFKIKTTADKAYYRKYCDMACYRENYKHDYAKPKRRFSLTR